MKRKLLVIFFIAIISSLFIYKFSPKRKEVLYIGEKEYLNDIKYSNFKKYLYDNITYKELINSIDNNDYIVLKNRRVYLNQLLSESDLIIIGANNIEYNKRCNQKNTNKKYYQRIMNNNKEKLNQKLKRMISSKIIILENYCIN